MRKTTVSRTILACLAALLLLAAAPALAQGAPVGGQAMLSLLTGITHERTVTAAILVDVNDATGTCGANTTVPAALGTYEIGVWYDASALRYIEASSCGVPQFRDPFCSDDGAVVECRGTNAVPGPAPQGVVCVAQMKFHLLKDAAPALGLLASPAPRGVATNMILGCGGPVRLPALIHSVQPFPHPLPPVSR